MKRCLLDLDGCLADFTKGSLAFHGLKDPYLDPANLGKYEIHALLGISKADYYGPLGEEFWAGLERTPEFDSILGAVENRFGEGVVIATSPVRTRGCYEGKLRWIEKHLPRYFRDRRFLVGPPKWFAAGPDAWLVDDSEANINEFWKWGGNPVLVPRPWNSLHGIGVNTGEWVESQLA